MPNWLRKINWGTFAFILSLLGAISISGLAFHAKTYWDAVMLLLIGILGFGIIALGFTKRNITAFITLIGLYLLIAVIIILHESDHYRNFMSKEKGRKLYLRDVVTVTSPIFCVIIIALTVYLHRLTMSPSVLRNGVIVRRDIMKGSGQTTARSGDNSAQNMEKQPLINDEVFL
jgi:hypothetical protein